MLELAGIVILGIFAQWIAWRIRVPAILPLIIIGLIVGPISTYFTDDNSKWIDPILNPGDTHGLFRGEILFSIVSLSIGVILFEGGMTLKLRELKGVRDVIFSLISIGSLVTFIGGGIAAHYIIGANWEISFLFAGLIIVTGPTVIAPILRNVPLNRNISTVLKWEGILIDPIGALVAVLVFQFIISGEGGGYTLQALEQFGKIVIIGTSIGFTSAYFMYYLIKRSLVPHYLLNVLILALVLGVFVASDIMAHESGLLAVVIMGMVLGNLKLPQLKGVLDFKESLSVLLISILFILLSANIEISHLEILLNWNCLILFLIVVFVLRPVGVFLSTTQSELSVNEKIFISWVGPRGIVAAGIASLFGIRLTGVIEGAEYVTPLVFMIVAGTVLLNAATARMVASWLGVTQKDSDGIMIIGINRASMLIGKYLQDNNKHVVLVDNNAANVDKAKLKGLEAIQENIYTDDMGDNIELLDVGYLLAMTSSPEVNKYAADKFKSEFGENGTYRLIAQDELKNGDPETIKEGLFSKVDDYINLEEVVRDSPEFHEVRIESKEHFEQLIGNMNEQVKSIPLFIKRTNGEIEILTASPEQLEFEEGDILVYLGQKADNLANESLPRESKPSSS